MASLRVLIPGGNGGTGRLIAESMLVKTWHVTSDIRDPRQEAGILQLGPKKGPKADVLVVDLARMKDEDASKIFKQVKPNYIVFAAGIMSNVNIVDRDAEKKIIKASVTFPEVTNSS